MAVEAAPLPIHQAHHALRPTGFEPLSLFILDDSCASKSAKQAKFLALQDANHEDETAPIDLPISADPNDDSGSISAGLSNMHILKGSCPDALKEKAGRKSTKKKNGKRSRMTRKAVQGLLVESGQNSGCEDNEVTGSSCQSEKGNATKPTKCEHDAEMLRADSKMHESHVKDSSRHANKENRRLRWHKSQRSMDHAQLNSRKMRVLDKLNVDTTMSDMGSSLRIQSRTGDETSSTSSVASSPHHKSGSSIVESSVIYPHEKVHPVTDACFSQSVANSTSSFDYRRNRGDSRCKVKLFHGASFYERQHVPRCGKDVTHAKTLTKWVPVCKKDVKNMKSTASVENTISCAGKSQSSSERNDDHIILGSDTVTQGLTASSKGTVSVSSGPSLISASEALDEPVVNRIEMHVQKAEHVLNGNASFVLAESFSDFINCLKVEHTFDTSYRLQLASERVERAIGYPLAEFERLLQCLTPVIASSFSRQACETCSCNQQHSPPICRNSIPSISLPAVWNWYEEPGNYGIKVGVHDSRDQEASRDDQVSFDAHFVPFLSAVQLFGYEKLSPRGSETEDKSVLKVENDRDSAVQSSVIEAPVIAYSSKQSSFESSLADRNSSAAFNSFEQPVGSSNAPDIHGLDAAGRSLPPLSDNMELMFEFFESEQPHQRMPLYDKVAELASAGISENHGFGDPSKLQCVNLRELHPASWFSVAWYPIYRIPEGKLHAAFLTYHSLGYSVHRCVATDVIDKNALCVLFPVIGLQSYRAQNEVWFHPKLKSDDRPALKELASRLLEDRIRTLEENALFLARGLVCKDHARVTNRQPDYEFFKSRE